MAIFRYARLWFSLARYSFLGELAFRGNFLLKVSVEVLWLSILLGFNFTIFQFTRAIADWSQYEYLFFIGCYFALFGMLETLFLDNCNNFGELVRTGNLDAYLLKPIDEQFLITCYRVDWSCLANVLMGVGVMIYALVKLGEPVDLVSLALFSVLFVCGVAMAYGFMLMLTSASLWFMRNQSLFEMWWLFTTLTRYPRELFHGKWAGVAGLIFSFVIPIMLTTNVPARALVKVFEWDMAWYAVGATVGVLGVSRWLFRVALQRYRSASS